MIEEKVTFTEIFRKIEKLEEAEKKKVLALLTVRIEQISKEADENEEHCKKRALKVHITNVAKLSEKYSTLHNGFKAQYQKLSDSYQNEALDGLPYLLKTLTEKLATLKESYEIHTDAYQKALDFGVPADSLGEKKTLPTYNLELLKKSIDGHIAAKKFESALQQARDNFVTLLKKLEEPDTIKSINNADGKSHQEKIASWLKNAQANITKQMDAVGNSANDEEEIAQFATFKSIAGAYGKFIAEAENKLKKLEKTGKIKKLLNQYMALYAKFQAEVTNVRTKANSYDLEFCNNYTTAILLAKGETKKLNAMIPRNLDNNI